jgi:hypothetical protein
MTSPEVAASTAAKPVMSRRGLVGGEDEEGDGGLNDTEASTAKCGVRRQRYGELPWS